MLDSIVNEQSLVARSHWNEIKKSHVGKTGVNFGRMWVETLPGLVNSHDPFYEMMAFEL